MHLLPESDEGASPVAIGFGARTADRQAHARTVWGSCLLVCMQTLFFARDDKRQLQASAEEGA